MLSDSLGDQKKCLIKQGVAINTLVFSAKMGIFWDHEKCVIKADFLITQVLDKTGYTVHTTFFVV